MPLRTLVVSSLKINLAQEYIIAPLRVSVVEKSLGVNSKMN